MERALDIFELLASSKVGLTLSDLSKLLDVPKSSVHYLLNTLQSRGYVHRNEATKRLLLGLKILTLSNAALSGIELRRHAAPHLRRLMERSGLTVHMAVLEGDEAVLVDKLEPSGATRVATWIGKRMDLHCSAVGKAIMAHLPEEQFERLARDRGFIRYNENTWSRPPDRRGTRPYPQAWLRHRGRGGRDRLPVCGLSNFRPRGADRGGGQRGRNHLADYVREGRSLIRSDQGGGGRNLPLHRRAGDTSSTH